jgi:hypothetical protein
VTSCIAPFTRPRLSSRAIELEPETELYKTELETLEKVSDSPHA